MIRAGQPGYQGPSIWYLWHTIAARVAELETKCDVDSSDMEDKILPNIKLMIGYFALTHPW